VDKYVEKMKKKGVYLSIFGVQDSVDVDVLDKLADFSYVLDFDSPLPTNIQNLIVSANGC
jgi:hypothetical protein